MVVYHAISTSGPLHGVPVNTPFQPLKLLDQKRILARKSNTTYCYDFALVKCFVLLTFDSCLFFDLNVSNYHFSLLNLDAGI